MADEIKAGSVVQLKSGGPLMTAAWNYSDSALNSNTALCSGAN
jgi:uncharacterized protein YodC (DUF2158 family)